MKNRKPNWVKTTRNSTNRFSWFVYRILSSTYVPILITLLVIVPVFAGVPVPDIPHGKGDKCVEPTDVMRKNHMEMILHQRDETMHRGIRTKKYSLKECLNCHAVKGDDSQPVGFDNPKHFCRVCHSYASVSIDCFDCHNSKPE